MTRLPIGHPARVIGMDSPSAIVGESIEEGAMLHNLRWNIKYALDTHDERRLKSAIDERRVMCRTSIADF